MRPLLTGRALRTLVASALAAFGLLALLLQFYQAVWGGVPYPGHGGLVACAVAALSAGYAVVRVVPRGPIRRQFHRPDFLIEIKPGDLFDERDAHLVIGFTDTFDTDTTDDRIIHNSSVQAQFLHREFNASREALDAALAAALAEIKISEEIPRQRKRHGKLDRYPVGTVAVLGEPRRYFFCVAYSTMTDLLTAQSSGDLIWTSLSHLWAEIFAYTQRGRVAMPVIGSALARVDALDRAGLLKLVLLSFVAASRNAVVTSALTIVVRPDEFAQLDRLEIEAFLRSL